MSVQRPARVPRLPMLVVLLASHGLVSASESHVISQSPAKLVVSGDRVVGQIVHLRFSALLRLEIVFDGELEDVEPARIDADPKTWRELRRQRPQRFRDGERTGWRQVVELEPLQPGSQTVHSIAVHYRNREGIRQSVEWKDVQAKIADPAGNDEQDIRGDVDIEQLPDEPAASGALVWFIAVAATLAMGIVGWQLLFRVRRRAVALRPEEWALRELEQLGKLDAAAAATVGSARLSAAVREYVQRRFALPAPQRTTEEFLLQAAEFPDLPAQERERLAAFLSQCDVAKFAGHGLGASDWNALLESARVFVHDTTPVNP